MVLVLVRSGGSDPAVPRDPVAVHAQTAKALREDVQHAFGAGWMQDADGVVVSDEYALAEGLHLTWYPSRGGCRIVHRHAHTPCISTSSAVIPLMEEEAAGGSVHDL